MDSRYVNFFFREPPSVVLCSPGAVAELDLSEPVREGKVLASARGDVPDFFHRRGIPEELSNYFALKGVSVKSLQQELKRRGIRTGRWPADAKHVAVVVVCMGWFWAPFPRHSALEDVRCSHVEGFETRGQLRRATAVPSFASEAYLRWIYIDDYLSCKLLDIAAEDPLQGVSRVAGSARSHLKEVGLESQKEEAELGVSATLGMTISVRPHHARVISESMSLIEGATRLALAKAGMSSRQMSVLLNSWVWVAMAARPALSIIRRMYYFVNAHADLDVARPLCPEVRDELRCLLRLCPLFFTDLEAGWPDVVFQVDASEEGFGVARTTVSPEEIREEAARAWTPCTDSSLREAMAEGSSLAGDEDRWRQKLGSPPWQMRLRSHFVAAWPTSSLARAAWEGRWGRRVGAASACTTSAAAARATS
jgi:hypothetical protein